MFSLANTFTSNVFTSSSSLLNLLTTSCMYVFIYVRIRFIPHQSDQCNGTFSTSSAHTIETVNHN